MYLLHRLKDAGIDIGWLNPFHWQHRRAWRKKVHADPLFSIANSMESAAKLSGDISKEQKSVLLDIYESDFKLSSGEAVELLSSNAYLIKDEERIYNDLEKFIGPSRENFSESQVSSTLNLLVRVLEVEERISDKQLEFQKRVEKALQPEIKQSANW